MSDLVALCVLGMCTFYAAWLSLEFSHKSKLHLLWTIPVGFFGCFASMAIFSLAISQSDDFLFITTVCVVFLPFPLWRIHKRREKAVLPTEQSAPKEILTPSSLFESLKNIKSNTELQTALSKKNKGSDLPPPEVSGSKYINPNHPDLKQHHEPFVGWRSDLKKEMSGSHDFSSNNVLPNGLNLGDKVSFFYTNAQGESSTRHFVIHNFDGLYLEGWDLDKRNSRTFRIDRIDGGIVKINTGEVFYF